MGFRQSFNVLRESIGSYVNGVFTPGVRSIITVEASIQPVTEQDLVTAPEGRRISDMVKVYSDTLLQDAVEATGQQPDLIAWRGWAYEINSISVRQMSVISHYKYFTTRRMALPAGYEAMWVAGTLNRG